MADSRLLSGGYPPLAGPGGPQRHPASSWSCSGRAPGSPRPCLRCDGRGTAGPLGFRQDSARGWVSEPAARKVRFAPGSPGLGLPPVAPAPGFSFNQAATPGRRPFPDSSAIVRRAPFRLHAASTPSPRCPVRRIAERIGRSPSTISRELRRNADDRGGYRATSAHALAWQRAARPKPAKLAANVVLRARVEQDLARRYSPEQIAGRLRREFPDDPEMRVSTETIYQSLYVQSRGALRRELTACLRTGRAMRLALPQGRAAQEPNPRHDQHLGAAC